MRALAPFKIPRPRLRLAGALCLFAALLLLIIPGHAVLLRQELDVITDIYNSWHPSGWNNSFLLACGFPGVSCDGPGTHIVRLSLFALPAMNGTIPNSIGNLTRLTTLQVPPGNISGTLPASIGNLALLSELDFSNNPTMTGTIPESLSGTNLTLTYLGLAQCGLSGVLPSFIGNFRYLRTLILNRNSFVGTIPESFANLTQLLNFDLASNALSGTIPSFLGNAASLRYLSLKFNQFTGTVPESLLNMSYSTFYLQSNRLDLCPAQNVSALNCQIGQQVTYSCCVWPGCRSSCIEPPSACTSPRPAPSFICPSGEWISTGVDVTLDTGLQVSSESVAIVNGSLTIPGDITFSSPSSIVISNGCASISGTITIDPSTEEWQTLLKGKIGTTSPQVLISQSPPPSGCNESLSSVPLLIATTKNNQKSCKKITVQRDSTSNANLVAVLFHVDSSACNTRWIILGSVLGGVLAFVIIIALVFTFNNKAKACIRPYWKREANKATEL